MSEDTFIPASVDSKTVEFDIIFFNMLIIVHLEVIDSIFSVGSGVYGTELSTESLDKIGPIIKPVRNSLESRRDGSKNSKAVPQR